MVKCCVLFEVRTEFLNNIKTIFGFKGLNIPLLPCKLHPVTPLVIGLVMPFYKERQFTCSSTYKHMCRKNKIKQYLKINCNITCVIFQGRPKKLALIKKSALNLMYKINKINVYVALISLKQGDSKVPVKCKTLSHHLCL
jgi:hypothetical protein